MIRAKIRRCSVVDVDIPDIRHVASSIVWLHLIDVQAAKPVIPFILGAEPQAPPLMDPDQFLRRRLHRPCSERRLSDPRIDDRSGENQPRQEQDAQCVCERCDRVFHDVILPFPPCPVKAIRNISSGDSPLRIWRMRHPHATNALPSKIGQHRMMTRTARAMRANGISVICQPPSGSHRTRLARRRI